MASESSDPLVPPDALLELPVQGVAVQVDDAIRMGDGVLELRYMPVHQSCVVTIKINDQVHASVALDGALFALVAAFTVDPQRTPEPGTVFKG